MRETAASGGSTVAVRNYRVYHVEHVTGSRILPIGHVGATRTYGTKSTSAAPPHISRAPHTSKFDGTFVPFRCVFISQTPAGTSGG